MAEAQLLRLGEYQRPLQTINKAIAEARRERNFSPAPLILLAKILVKEAGVSGRTERIDDAFDAIKASGIPC